MFQVFRVDFLDLLLNLCLGLYLLFGRYLLDSRLLNLFWRFGGGRVNLGLDLVTCQITEEVGYDLEHIIVVLEQRLQLVSKLTQVKLTSGEASRDLVISVVFFGLHSPLHQIIKVDHQVLLQIRLQ